MRPRQRCHNHGGHRKRDGSNNRAQFRPVLFSSAAIVLYLDLSRFLSSKLTWPPTLRDKAQQGTAVHDQNSGTSRVSRETLARGCFDMKRGRFELEIPMLFVVKTLILSQFLPGFLPAVANTKTGFEAASTTPLLDEDAGEVIKSVCQCPYLKRAE